MTSAQTAGEDMVMENALQAYVVNVAAPEEAETEAVCLLDSGTTNTILRSEKFFDDLTPNSLPVRTILGAKNVVKAQGRARLRLPNGTEIVAKDALYAPKAGRNLLSFQDIRRSGYHVQTSTIDGLEYLHLTDRNGNIMERLAAHCSGLYSTRIEAYLVESKPDRKSGASTLWHARFGHPGQTMMRKITKKSTGHDLRSTGLSASLCVACSKGKLIVRPSKGKIPAEAPPLLSSLHGDICRPISPASGPYRYYLVIVDASA